MAAGVLMWYIALAAVLLINVLTVCYQSAPKIFNNRLMA